MFKINDPIVGTMYRLVDMDITKPFLLVSVYLTIGSLYETYPTCFDITDQSTTIGSECIRTVWSVYGTGPLCDKNFRKQCLHYCLELSCTPRIRPYNYHEKHWI